MYKMKIFISYSRMDASDYAKYMYEYFSNEGHDVFIDVNSIRIGDAWASSITENISNCDIFIVILTRSYLQPEIEKEVFLAQKEKKLIIPCKHKAVDYEEIKWGLKEIQGIEFEDKFQLVSELDRIIKYQIENIWSDKGSHYVPTLKDIPAIEDKLGRKSLAKIISNTIERVQNDNLTEKVEGPFIINIHGPWGSGKTTLSNFIGEELEKKDPPWVIVKLNAWEYQRLTVPPWWLLMDSVYREGYKKLRRWHKFKLLISEFLWRLWTKNSNILIGIILFSIFLAITIFFFSQTDLSTSETNSINSQSNDKILDLIKGAAGLIGLAGSLITGIVLIRNSIIPKSVESVRDLIDKTNDPTRKFNNHFKKIIKKINRPIVVFIDDLDRCKENYVVEFLEGIHTIFKNLNIIYIVTADQRWIYTSYEKTYDTFNKLNENSGSSLGYLFMDKIFQLLVPLPKLTDLDQRNYLNFVLFNKLENNINQNELDKEVEISEDPNKIIDIVNRGTGNPIHDRLLRERAVLKLNEKDIQRKTEHFLQPFVKYLEPNPRSIIRFVNIFNIVRTVNILSAVKIDNKKLALWLIIALRWPILARYLQNNPDKIQKIGKINSTNNIDIPNEILSLFNNLEINNIINKNTLGISIDEKTIDEIILWSI